MISFPAEFFIIMAKLSSFTFITINGYVSDLNGDISWHRHGVEENQYAMDGLNSENYLVFGRKTYEMMASFWPSPMALENDPDMAKGMNNAKKLVFSNTIEKANWQNTRIVRGDAALEMERLKETSPFDLTILGSGTLLTFFALHNLVDEYQVMIDPVALGEGVPVFKGFKGWLNLTLNKVQKMSSGVILLQYLPER